MRNIKKRTAVFIFCMVLTIIMARSLTAIGEPKYGGTLRIGVRVPQHTMLDVRYGTLETMIPSSGMIYDCLYNWGEDGYNSLVPQLATAYETTDNKEWIIHLRKGVKFHNGREMTAEDVKTNFDWRIQTPKGWKPVKFKELIKYLKAVEVIDRYTIKVILEKPFSPLMRVLAYAMRGIGPPEEVEKYGKDPAPPCGTGPYKVVEIKPNEKVVLERFDDYWGPKPYFDRLEYKYIRSDDARLIALEKGELDMAQLLDEAIPIIDKNSDLTYQTAIGSTVLHKHYINFRRWPGNDVRFRKALWMGADWKNISINTSLLKQGPYARTLLEYSKYFNPDALKLVPPYDPEEARKLIQAVEKDAGKKLPPIHWLDTNRAIGKSIGEPAKLQLAQVGIPLELALLSHAIWYQKVYKDPKIEWDTAGYGAGFAIDPVMGFSYFVSDSGVHFADGKSLGGYSNPEFDRLIEKAEASIDEQERITCYHRAEQMLLNDVAVIPMVAYKMVIAYNKKVKGFNINDTLHIYPTNTWSNMWIEE